MFLLSLILQVLLFNFSVFIGVNANAPKLLYVEGEDATVRELPYQVAVLNLGEPICGGSLIKSNVVLTVAHCLGNKHLTKDTPISIRAGSNYNDKDGHEVKVVRVSRHPKYNPNTSDYDVAVLLLEEHVPLGPTIKPIELQHVNEEVPYNTSGLLSGWRRKKLTHLKKYPVRKLSSDECNIAKVLAIEKKFSATTTCYAHINGGLLDFCQGYAGDPVVVKGKQVGIVAWGVGCFWPILTTDVAHEEIQAHIMNSILME